MDRHILLHYHVYKNAGTTVDALLRRNFGANTGHVEGPEPWSTLDRATLLRYALDNPSLRAISSHQARFPAPEHAGLTFHPLLLLRDPVDRAASVYRFELVQPDSSLPGRAIARTEGFPGYVDWALGAEGTAVIRDFQTVFVASRERDMRYARATPADFETACARLDALPFVGLVETFDASMELLRSAYEPFFGPLDVRAGRLNASPGRAGSAGERREQIRAQLGRARFERLRAANAFDERLHARAATLVFALERRR